ncbi:MAG: hypothetical protein WA929_04770 [Pseudomonas neustonica]
MALRAMADVAKVKRFIVMLPDVIHHCPGCELMLRPESGLRTAVS